MTLPLCPFAPPPLPPLLAPPGSSLKRLVLSSMVEHVQQYRIADALRWCKQLAEALAYLHGHHPPVRGGGEQGRLHGHYHVVW